MNIPEKYINKHSPWMDLIAQNKFRFWDYSPIIDIKPNTIGTYIIYNPETLEFYIGSSVDIYQRLSKHRTQLLNRFHDNLNVQKSFEKSHYFQMMFFITSNRDEAYQIEQDLINANIDDPLMLNISTDVRASRKGLKFSDEVKEKMKKSWDSERRIKVLENLKEAHKKLHTPEKIEELRQRMMGNKYGTGQIVSEERRRMTGLINKGKTLSIETREKISKTKKEAFANGCPRSRAKPIMINGIRYVSCNEAAGQLEIPSGLVWHRVNSNLDKYRDWTY